MRALRVIVVLAILLVLAVPFWNVLMPVEADDGGDTVELELRYGILDMSVDVPADLEGQYASSLVPRLGLEEYRLYTFVTPDDPAVRALADRIESVTPFGGDVMKAEVALNVVHENVRYATDQEMHGRSDYWQYPAETLISGEGDCEDQALLLASILEALGLDTVLIIEPGHVSVGVCTGSTDGSTVEYHGRQYQTADPTIGGHLGEHEADVVSVIPSTSPNVWTYVMLGGSLVLIVAMLYAVRRTGV